MAREGYKSTELAKDLPKLGEILRTKKGTIKSLAGNEDSVDILWDLSAKCKEYQVFELRVGDRRVRLSKQAFEHYLRAV
jgi:hypothetical protein